MPRRRAGNAAGFASLAHGGNQTQAVLAGSPSCPLTSLARVLHLACFMAADQHLMARHFVRHYHGNVGVPLGRMRFWIQSNRTFGAKDAASYLEEEGLQPENLVIETSVWSDRLMLQLLNAYIQTIPKRHYLIYANVDEFYSFPCDMPQRIAAGQQLFCMCMQDRLASSGRVTTLLNAPGIDQQYPLACYVRQNLRPPTFRQMSTAKIALMLVSSSPERGRRQFKSPHRLSWQFGKMGRCHVVGKFAHFTMTTQYVESIQHKLRSFSWVANVRAEYERQLQFLEEHLAERPGSPDLRSHPWCVRPPRGDECTTELAVESAKTLPADVPAASAAPTVIAPTRTPSFGKFTTTLTVTKQSASSTSSHTHFAPARRRH